MKTKRFRVKIRRDLRHIRPEAEQLDGRVFDMQFYWKMDDCDPYPGEDAWGPAYKDGEYPKDAPQWIASGDLVEVDAE